jgi:hypothetical protein
VRCLVYESFWIDSVKVLIFYLPHMEHERSIGLVTEKMKKKIIADFHVLVLLWQKNLMRNSGA